MQTGSRKREKQKARCDERKKVLSHPRLAVDCLCVGAQGVFGFTPAGSRSPEEALDPGCLHVLVVRQICRRVAWRTVIMSATYFHQLTTILLSPFGHLRQRIE